MTKTIIKYVLIFLTALLVVQWANTIKQRSIQFERTSSSGHWYNIDQAKFDRNLEANTSESLRLYQGTGTNLCGFAAITYHLIKHEPVQYRRMVEELYTTGQTITPSGKVLKPSSEILQYAGTLRGNGRLDINHADQLWFLTLADQYKGYVNFLNWRYDYGDESSTWASTNLRKFNTIWSTLTGKEVHTKGADLIRPPINNYYQYIKDLQSDYTIMLYLNNTVLTQRDFSSITFPIPTHFIELYDIYPRADYYVIEYWDYGFKTKEIIDKDTFNDIIFGISYVKKNKL